MYSSDNHNLALLDVIGVTQQSGRFTHAYLNLPDGWGYLLPLDNVKVFRRALDLYPAQGKKARLGKTGLRWLSKLGMRGIGLPKVGLKEREGSVFQTLRRVFGRDDLVFGVSLGMPGPHRKPVIQVMTPEGEVLGYAKVGWNEATRALVKNEVRAIKRIKELEIPRLLVPDLIYFSGGVAFDLLVTQPFHGVGCNRENEHIHSVVLEVLIDLAACTRQEQSFIQSNFWEEINQRAERIKEDMPEYQKVVLMKALKVMEKKLGNTILPWTFRLGDVTRWNIAVDVQANSLRIIDPEYAKENWLTGWDIFHFSVAGNRFPVAPDFQLVEMFLGNLGVPENLVRVLYLAYLVDLFTEWIEVWQDAGIPVSPTANSTLRDLGKKIWSLSQSI